MNGLYFAAMVAVVVIALIVVPYAISRGTQTKSPRRVVARGWRGWRWNEDWKVDWTWDGHST